MEDILSYLPPFPGYSRTVSFHHRHRQNGFFLNDSGEKSDGRNGGKFEELPKPRSRFQSGDVAAATKSAGMAAKVRRSSTILTEQKNAEYQLQEIGRPLVPSETHHLSYHDSLGVLERVLCQTTPL